MHYIAIDKAHIIWGWRDFKKEYWMLRYLKDIYPTIFILALLATIISNIFDYIQVFVKFLRFLRIHRQLLNWSNLCYIISPICKSGFQNLAFLIFIVGSITDIIKTMIFVNKVKDIIEL